MFFFFAQYVRRNSYGDGHVCHLCDRSPVAPSELLAGVWQNFMWMLYCWRLPQVHTFLLFNFLQLAVTTWRMCELVTALVQLLKYGDRRNFNVSHLSNGKNWTPWSWALLEKPPVVQLLKNFVFYGTQRFIIVFTRTLHWSLSWARSIQSIPPIKIKIHLNIILPPTSKSSWWSLLLAFPPKTYMHSSSPPLVLHAPPNSSSLTW
jgi:hypothetical protein